MIKRYVIVPSIIVIIILSLLSLVYLLSDKNNVSNIEDCLISKGYSYDQDLGICLQYAENDESDIIDAASISAEKIKKDFDLEDIYLKSIHAKDCEGCYYGEFRYEDRRFFVNIFADEIDILESDITINYCDDKRPEYCISEYSPVCGFFGQKIQCFKAPCATTYSNPCQACSDENVDYWTEGECK